MRNFISASLMAAMLLSAAACSGGSSAIPQAIPQQTAHNTTPQNGCGAPQALRAAQSGRTVECGCSPQATTCSTPNPYPTPAPGPVTCAFYCGGTGGTGGGGGGGGTGGGTVATQGKAIKGRPCIGGNGNSGHAIGDALDGAPDKSGKSGNEVDNIYRVQANVFGVYSDVAFVYHTFNGENFIQPVVIPGAATVSIRGADGPTITNSVQIRGLLSHLPNTGWSDNTKQFAANSSIGATSYDCFDGDWDGTSQAAG